MPLCTVDCFRQSVDSDKGDKAGMQAVWKLCLLVPIVVVASLIPFKVT